MIVFRDLEAAGRRPLDPAVLQSAAAIVEDVRARGEVALRAHAERLGDLEPGSLLVHNRAALAAAFALESRATRSLLVRTARRIREFARAQRGALVPLDIAVPGGHAGHTVDAVERAGCYAPGGRFPLPSSVLMTAVTARAAGVREVWVASPRPSRIVLAAAHVAGADALVAVGGAQAIAALAYGAGPVPPCDVVVGPGNSWVTAAKSLVAGHVVIDMLAGPSELVVLADESADPALVAADLLAQAEHDPEALPILISLDRSLPGRVERELAGQLAALPGADVARAALAHGFFLVARDETEAIAACNAIAPEHVELMVRAPRRVLRRLSHYGAAFLGRNSAEVFGDYGAGPNHVLPTGGASRGCGGLSVLTFLRVRTWLRLDVARAPALARDTAALARLEGLEGHARAADLRASRRR
jgi:phosphoribosyl-ATP pyrophosphohydrolase/phosphoribosyl-AMP cyclohydrolase/histidinol dehydrogenase